MVLLAAGSPLVAGASPEGQMAREIPMQKVRVERSFYYNREPQPVGTVLDVPVIFASELFAVGKASVYVQPEEPPKRRKKEIEDAG